MRRLQSHSSVVPFNIPLSEPLTLSLGGPSLPAGLSFTRASSATWFNQAGAIQLAGTNVPRFDYHPVNHRYLGLFLEEGSTNLLLNSLLDGTNLSTQTVTISSGQNYTISFYGTGTITLSGAVSHVVTGSPIANDRVEYFFTAGTNSVTATVAGTVKWAQLEIRTANGNASATSFIPTTGTSASRSPDFAEFTGSAFSILQGAQGAAVLTLNKRAQVFSGPSGIIAGVGVGAALGGLAFIDFDTSGGANNSCTIGRLGQAFILTAWAGGGSPQMYLPSSGSGAYVSPLQKVGYRWGSGNYAISLNGMTPATSGSTTTFDPAANFYLGSYGPTYGGWANIWVQSIVLYPQALPLNNNAFQAACALPAPGINDGIPQGALDMGYSTLAFNLSPTTSDIAPDQTAGTYPLYDGVYWNPGAPQENANYSMTNGILTMPLRVGGVASGVAVCTQTRNSVAGSLGYLNGANGFYIEFTVALDNNDNDHWPAVWCMPQEHNLALTDNYTGAPYFDPAGYERWMELDVDEGGFSANCTATMNDWQGTWDPANPGYWRDYPTDTIPGVVINNLVVSGFLDRTQFHTFGASYDPVQGIGRWYIDDQMFFVAAAPSVAAIQHFYLIAGPQTHGGNVDYNMYLKRFRAYTP